MSHHKGYQRIGLASMLLVAGMMGGLIAPHGAEASGQSLTFVVDDTTHTILLNNQSCTTTGIDTTKAGPTPTIGATLGEADLGYTHCYRIPLTDASNQPKVYSGKNAAGVTRSWKIVPLEILDVNGRSYIPAQFTQPSLLIGDQTDKDLMKLSGLRVVPVGYPFSTTSTPVGWGTTANTNEKHILKFIMSNKFDVAFKPASTTDVKTHASFGLRTGGYFEGQPTSAPGITYCAYNDAPHGYDSTAPCDAVSNSVTFTATGLFDPLDPKNLTDTATGLKYRKVLSVSPCYTPGTNTTTTCPTINLTDMSFAVSTVTSNLSFGVVAPNPPKLNQISPYPIFPCNDRPTSGTAYCKPTITQTMVVTMYGPDILTVTNGADGGGCTDCNRKTVKDLDEWFQNNRDRDKAEAVKHAAEQGPDCARGQCQCSFQDWCDGTVKINVNYTPGGTATGNHDLNFVARGLDFSDFTTRVDDKGRGSFSFSEVGEGAEYGPAPGGSFRTILSPTDPQRSVQTDNFVCSDEIGTDPVQLCTVLYADPTNSVKTGVRVYVRSPSPITVNVHAH